MGVIVVQRGHVPLKTGATGTPGEQAFAIAAAERCRVRLAEIGHQTRIIDADPILDDYRGDMFIAIHCDGFSNPSAHGMSVGYQTDEGEEAAHLFQKRYELHGWNRGFRTDNNTTDLHFYYGVREAVQRGNRRAFIVECGFLTNSDDKALLASADGHDRVARALADTVALTLKSPTMTRNLEVDDMPLNDADKEFIRKTVLDAVRNEGISGAADASIGANKVILERLAALEAKIGE